MKITFDKHGFQINDTDAFLISGEFHYFRVPHTDWKRRMELFKQAGGNVIATYVPWIIHEPEEGDIRFGDCPQRDLKGFLETARQVGLGVVLRPGPYQYSELVNDGLPEWLVRDYPQIQATYPDGSAYRRSSVSYLHPVFLEKTRKYYKAFADVVRPYMDDPVVMLQVDNEATGIHIWFGSIDYNPETMGFGKEDGRYPCFLRKTYGTIEAVNRAYGTAYAAFTDVPAPRIPEGKDLTQCRSTQDYYHFYYETVAEYLTLLRSWLEEDGLRAPICHNAAGPEDIHAFQKTVQAMGKEFLLGADHYYTLGQHWKQNNPTPQHAVRIFVSLERLRLLGMPQSVLEMPGGSPSDTPPILKEDLLAWYRTNVAFGMKGVNYYVFTGGRNFPGTGTFADVYDYNALVHADGSLNETYEAAKDIGLFMKENGWLQRAKRRSSVAVGFEWEQKIAEECVQDGGSITSFMEKGIVHTLLCSRYAPELTSLDGDLELGKPLIVPTDFWMSETVQKKLVAFVQKGGKLLLLGKMPVCNERYEPCTILQDFCGNLESEKQQIFERPLCMNDGTKVYQVKTVQLLKSVPDGCSVLAEDGGTGKPVGFRKDCGGTLMWLGIQWQMGLFVQAQMLEQLLEQLGAQPVVNSSNRNLFTSVLRGENGRQLLFVMNLYSGAQSTQITLYHSEKTQELEKIQLNPMEVRILEI